jgi:hypothetical protein
VRKSAGAEVAAMRADAPEAAAGPSESDLGVAHHGAAGVVEALLAGLDGEGGGGALVNDAVATTCRPSGREGAN